LEKVCPDLIEEARPDLYQKNAFRTLRITAEASDRQINRQAHKWILWYKTGLGDALGEDSAEGAEGPPGREALRRAMQRIREPQLRFLDEFFWFWPVRDEQTGFGPELYREMLRGSEEDARRLWNELGETGKGQHTYCHNSAVLAHTLALDLEEAWDSAPGNEETKRKRDFFWGKAYEYWERCLSQEAVWQRIRDKVRLEGDPRLTTGYVKRFRESLPLALTRINAELCLRYTERGDTEEARRHMALIQQSGFDPELTDQALRLVSGPLVEYVKHQCLLIRKKIERQPSKAQEFCRSLFQQTEKMVGMIRDLLPPEHPNRQAALDEVASEGLEILLADTARGGDLRGALVLLEYAAHLAAGDALRQRIGDHMRFFRRELEYQPCWFCDEYLADEPSSVVVEHHRTGGVPLPEGQTQPARIPRCARCKFIHLRGKLVFTMTCLAGGWLGLVVSRPLISIAPNTLAFTCVLASVCAGLYAGWLIGRSAARRLHRKE